MPFDKSHYARQQRRRGARAAQIDEQLVAANHLNRRARRVLASRKPDLLKLPTAWVAGLLEGKARVGLKDTRPSIAIEASPRVLTALRRRVGGVVDGKVWRAEGNRAESILTPELENLVTLQKEAVFAIALQDYRRRLNRKLTRADIAAARSVVG